MSDYYCKRSSPRQTLHTGAAGTGEPDRSVVEAFQAWRRRFDEAVKAAIDK